MVQPGSGAAGREFQGLKLSGFTTRVLALAIVALALIGFLAPLPAHLVEQYYSTALFPLLQRAVTTVSNLTAVAIIDVLLLGFLAWLLGETLRAIVSVARSGQRRPLIVWLARVIVGSALVVLAFFVLWGLNYRREPLVEKVRFDPAAVSPEGARRLAGDAVDHVNRLYEEAHAGDALTQTVDPSLASAFAEAQRALGVGRAAIPGRPKQSMLDVYFKSAGVAGMTDPFFLETLVASDLVPFERSQVIAHEWGHLAGFADEGEANFVGWLTCMKGSPAAQYSGWMFLYGEVAAGVPEADRRALSARLDPGPRADLRAAFERTRRNVSPVVADAGWRVYDRYLKANRVEAGRESYRDVVRLVLGIRLDPDKT